MEVAGLTGREIERSWRQAKGRKCRNCVEVKELHFVLFVLVGSSQEFVNGQHCNFYWKTLLCRKLVNIWSLLSWVFFFLFWVGSQFLGQFMLKLPSAAFEGFTNTVLEERCG